MSLPSVAIVGRPNVGKSSLLNSLTRRRVSIVDPTPGVTRDRVSAVCEIDDKYFELIDTGGYGIEDIDNLTEHIEGQIQYAIAGASLILFVVDAMEQITPLDLEVARLLRRVSVPVLLVANKCDSGHQVSLAGALVSLGFGEPLCVSALHGHNRRELMEQIITKLGENVSDEAPSLTMKVVLVGRRNVGKSTFINALAGYDRVIVSEIPGTTRDSIDVNFEIDGEQFMAIDTAGVKKKRKHKNDIEYYGYTRALGSIRRADVVLFLIDAEEPIGEVDKKLAGYVVDEYKPCIIVVNKWDLAKGSASVEDYADYTAKMMPHLAYAPLAFTTAKDGKNIKSTIDLARSLFNQAQARVTTGQLNRVIEEAVQAQQPMAGKQGGQPKLYYATQVATCPPTIVLFVNDTALIREQYRRFVEKRLRAALPFAEVPLRLIWRARESQEGLEVGVRPKRKGIANDD